jgi:P27 family predicted phage terminase small subunit
VAGHHVTVARPAAPRSLKGEARAEWNRVVPELEEMGVVASIDRSLLLRYCTAWADWCELDGLLQQSSKLIRGQKGNLVRNPVWLLRRDAEETLMELGRQLGLSPMARLRAGVVHDRPRDDGEDERRLATIEGYRRRLEGEPDPRLALRE